MKPNPTVVVLAVALFFIRSAPTTGQETFDFALHKDFLVGLRSEKTITPSFSLEITERSDIHSLSKDCEVHLGAKFSGETLAVTMKTRVDPPGVVVEPPNVCKFAPGATTMSATSPSKQWRTLLDNQVLGQTCQVSGFPRLFTEHAAGGDSGGSNPNHVFEIHPATKMVCGSNTVSFENFIAAPAGLRHIQSSSAASCLAGRKLEIKRNGDMLLFRESGGHGCGNFAIIEISHAHAEWRRNVGGGHSIIARVTADGDETQTLKIYTIAGSRIDDWVQSLDDANPDTQRRIVHGLITYDYFTLWRSAFADDGSFASGIDTWKEIDFPLAFIAFGETATIPWEEQ